MQRRIYELDALRGIAALAVVIYHFTTRYSVLYGFDEDPLFSLPLGHYGVQLFFVVSGFVIFLSLNNCKHPADFIVSRFARLYPVYWAAVIITFSTVTWFGLEGRERTVIEALINLTMLQGFFDVPDVEGVYWTLKWELTFYFWALMIFMFNLQKYAIHACALLLLSQWGTVLMETYFYGVPRLVRLVFLNTYGNLFVAGVLFYLLMFGQPRPIIHILIGVSLFNQYLMHGLESFFVTVGIFTLFYLFVYEKIQFLAQKPLILLGTISYSLYLIHEYVGWILMRELMAAGVSSTVAVLCAIGMALTLAYFMTFKIEHPAMAKIKKVYKQKYRARFAKA
ncbi:MAG: acyltransferase [Ketobacteraceae bacterium]|nr:acyltransferase [Ketobacteraceae bacterium]